MDFEAIWQAHKPFILKVGGGALAVLILTAWQSSVLSEAETLAATSDRSQGQLLDGVDALEGGQGEDYELGREQAIAERLEPLILDAILWRPSDGFELPEDDSSPALFYATALEAARSRVAESAQTWAAAVPRDAAGLGLPVDVPEARVPEALAQADVVQRFVRDAIDAGVRIVREVRLAEVGYIELAGVGGFLREVPLTITFEGDTEVLAAVLAKAQAAGSFLEVLGCEVERSGDRPEDPVVVTLEVQALAIVDAMPETRSAREDDRRRPSTRRRRRFGRER